MNVGSMEPLIAAAVTVPGWFKENNGLVIAVATVVIAISAVLTFFLTWALVRDNRLLRKAETEPEVVAYLAIHPFHYGFLNFVVANVGRGPARNVKFELDISKEELIEREILLKNSVDRKPISFLPQGEVFTVHFGEGERVHSDPRLPPFNVKIEYENLKGKQRDKTCLLDVAQFDDLWLLGSPPEKDIARSLEKIEQHLKAFAQPIKNMGDIPKSLESHSWKGVRLQLDTFGEIAHALLSGRANDDGHNEVPDFVAALKAESSSGDLTAEAKAILKASAAGNGIIIYRHHSRGQDIQAGGGSLIPDQRPRTIATWMGGLEDLQHRRYIRDVSLKGEMFRVTREGYDAAENLA